MAGLLTEDPVAETLRRWSAEPFTWGESDCALAVLGHIERVTGTVLTDRPAYFGIRGAQRYQRRRGGFGEAVAEIMTAYRATPVAAPEHGDVGLVELETGLTAAICLGNGLWAAKGHMCAVIGPVRSIAAAWRLR